MPSSTLAASPEALEIQLTPLLSARVCPYCRCEAEGRLWTCSACKVSLHADCYAELATCPTVGCAPAPVQAPPPFPAPLERTPASAPQGAPRQPLHVVTPATLPPRAFRERVTEGLRGTAELTKGVLIFTTLLCLIPSLFCGVLAAEAFGQTHMPFFEWARAIKAGLTTSLLTLALTFTISLFPMTRLVYFCRALTSPR